MNIVLPRKATTTAAINCGGAEMTSARLMTTSHSFPRFSRISHTKKGITRDLIPTQSEAGYWNKTTVLKALFVAFKPITYTMVINPTYLAQRSRQCKRNLLGKFGSKG